MTRANYPEACEVNFAEIYQRLRKGKDNFMALAMAAAIGSRTIALWLMDLAR